MQYPNVRDEFKTLEELHKGKSIARFGDGEFKLCGGADCVSQRANPKLKSELIKIAHSGSTDKCLVGVPPLNNPKIHPQEFWSKQVKSASKYVIPRREYHSSFITRPDNAPWIDTKEYWESLVDLWRDKHIILVLGSDRSLCERNIQDAASVKYVYGLYRDSYMGIDIIQHRILAERDKKVKRTIVIACLGATATCLAWRLCSEIQVIDAGHLGMKSFFKKGRGIE